MDPVLTRRSLFKLVAAAGVGSVTGAAAYGLTYERRRLLLVESDLAVSGLPPPLDGLRVGLVTDIHHSPTVPAADVARAVEMVQRAAPDLVVLGGDYVTYADRRFIGPAAELLAPLAAAPQGAFAIMGNHDDDREVPAALATRGFTVLRDQRTRAVIRGEPVDIAGIRFWTRRPDEVARVVRGASATTWLLAHDPRRLVEAAGLGVPLVLSGHTHGGQVVLPGIGAIVGRKFPVLAGPARRDGTTLFVSRGVGTVYIPIRLNCPPEVAVLTLRQAADG